MIKAVLPDVSIRSEADDLLDQWASAAVVELHLPSGWWVKLRPTDMLDAIQREIYPLELVAAAMRKDAAESASSPIETDLKAGFDFLIKRQSLAASAIIAARKTETDDWHDLTVPVEKYRLLPPADKEAIEDAIELDGAAPEAEGPDAFREFPERRLRDHRRPNGRKVRAAALGDARQAAPSSNGARAGHGAARTPPGG